MGEAAAISNTTSSRRSIRFVVMQGSCDNDECQPQRPVA
jgi:hypothetical protein